MCVFLKGRQGPTIEEKVTVFEAISRTTEKTPYIQCATQEALNIKLKPIDGIDRCEVYHNGKLINQDYEIPRYELKQPWKAIS